jgi:phospholipid/cholesterol/gamma-HCH transport system ATP-binding protein
MSVIRFEKIKKAFGDHQVLRGVSFEIQKGVVHILIGGSGAGKSVIIKHIVGLLSPDSGQIWLEDQELSGLNEKGFHEVRKRCQMIFQHATLFDSMSVLENVAMPIEKRFRLPKEEAEEKALRALKQVHADQLSRRFPPDLGAGVRKRVAIARAIALDPEILLYDEPTTGLDPVAARRTDRLIREMSDKLGITSVVVSHDLDSVSTIADCVTFLYQGTILFDGNPQQMLESPDPILHNFVHAGGTRWTYGQVGQTNQPTQGVPCLE